MSPQASRQTAGQQGDGASSVDAASAAYAVHLFEKADSIQKDYEQVIKARTANRESLRNMQAQGDLTAEQVTKLDELYPERHLSEEALARREQRKQERAKEREAKAKAEAEAKKRATAAQAA